MSEYSPLRRLVMARTTANEVPRDIGAILKMSVSGRPPEKNETFSELNSAASFFFLFLSLSYYVRCCSISHESSIMQMQDEKDKKVEKRLNPTR